MQDEKIYLKRMNDVLQQKLFFLSKIDISTYDTIVDFGCADGVLLNAIEEINPNKKCRYFGIDNNETFIRKARAPSHSIMFFLFDIEQAIKYQYLFMGGKNLVIFSSVLHEATADFKRCGETALTDFMQIFDTVVIRDMIAPVKGGSSASKEHIAEIKGKLPKWQVNSFENVWGAIDTREKLYHFLLKNEFVENWGTEVQENYFATEWEKIIKTLSGYKIAYDRMFTLPYRAEQVEKAFGFKMIDVTHRELILQRSMIERGQK